MTYCNQQPFSVILMPSKLFNSPDAFNSIFKQLELITGVKKGMLVSGERKRKVSEVRHMLVYFLRLIHPKFRLKEIGALLNGRDHSTILHALDTCKDYIKTDKVFRSKINAVKEKLICVNCEYFL